MTKLYLKSQSPGSIYGRIGKNAKISDENGVKLRVGDKVKVKSRTNGYEPYGLAEVCKEKGREAFVMGIAGSSCGKSSQECETWMWIKVEDHSQWKLGDTSQLGFTAVDSK